MSVLAVPTDTLAVPTAATLDVPNTTIATLTLATTISTAVATATVATPTATATSTSTLAGAKSAAQRAPAPKRGYEPVPDALTDGGLENQAPDL